MQWNSQKAGRYVAIAHFSGDVRKTVVFSPETSIREIFEAYWPEGDKECIAGTQFHPLPMRIEIVPDEKTLPPDDRMNWLTGTA